MLLAVATLQAGTVLPVFLADNHSQSFAWVSRTLDLDEPHVLVLVDAHSDASAVERSDEVRERLRRVVSVKERAQRVEDWRQVGRVQAFNWIEPLMPRPFERVLWIAGRKLSVRQAQELAKEAGDACDGRIEVEPRSAGALADRWQVDEVSALAKWNPGGRAVLLSIDLDFFAGMESAEEVFDQIWSEAMDWQGLAGVCISVSRPWLVDDAEADRLVRMVVSAVRRTRGAVLELDGAIDDTVDHSLKAAEFEEGQVPRWDLAQVSSPTAAEIALLGDRCQVRGREWHAAVGRGRIVLDGGEIDIDGVWRVKKGDEVVLRVVGTSAASGRVRWRRLHAARAAYDLMPETGLGKGFAPESGRWIYEQSRALVETSDFALAQDDWGESSGRVRIEGEYQRDGAWIPLATVEIRVGEGHGFRRALSECFGMPYVFGVAAVVEGDLSGVETGWGSDCSNFLVHAWRRSGVGLVWGDPGMLRRQLEEVKGRLPERAVESGVMVDFGSHVAALWEDREPRGVVGAEDLVVHHLGGVPELILLGELAKNRPPFRVWMANKDEGPSLRFAGDVVLVDGDRWVVEGFGKGEEDIFAVNLEGVPSMKKAATSRKYNFRFPAANLIWLKQQGVDVVSLANNHAGDAGPQGLMEGIVALKKLGIGVCGAGENLEQACQPWVGGAEGKKVAIFGVSLVEALAAGEGPGVAVLPGCARVLEWQMRRAKAKGMKVVVMVHGGDEYQVKVNENQRHWSRWLVARGADVLVGAHPHVIQRDEWHAGARVFHSLGNAVYPEKLSGLGEGKVIDLEERPAVETPQRPSVIALGAGRFRLGSVIFDKSARTITIPAAVNMRKDAVEYVLVTRNGKAHESIFITDVEPRDVHLAALLLGAEASADLGAADAAVKVPKSAALEAWIEWDRNGPPGKLPLHESIALVDPGIPGSIQPMSASLWLYNGSRVLPDGGFMASRDGSLISIIRDPDALVNNPGATRDDDDVHIPNAASLPKLQHPVRVVLRLR